jgi:nitroreductase
LIVICHNSQESWKRALDDRDHGDVDIAIASDHMTLMATAKGLGTCWVCNFNPAKVREALQLPDDLHPLVLLPIGYPGELVINPVKKRKKLEEIAFYNDLSTSY